MTPDQSKISDTATNLRRAIDEKLVTTVFQPIVGLDHAGITAYEALTRPAPESGFKFPDQLFDAAEDLGLIWELECVTRRCALQAAADWPIGAQLFLNSTPQVIADERFTDTILAELAEIDGLTPARIVLEVTERSENHHVEGLQRQTAALQDHGFKIAIDDVGAGTSGLNRIMLLRPQWLKLDRALIAGIDRDPVRTNLIRFLTHFARLSGVSIVGEGVERVEELERLIQLGVDAIQGYLLGRPGEAGRTLDPKYAAIISEQRGLRGASVFQRDRTDTVGQLASPLIPGGPSDLAVSFRDALDADSNAAGVVIDGPPSSAAWCSRESIFALGDQDQTSLGSCAVPFVRTLDTHEKVDNALEITATLGSVGLDTPLAVTDGARASGIIRIRDLLRAGSELCRDVRHRSATLTGLPGRVRCEEELQRAFGEDSNRDAVFIDIRNLSEYNAVFGFDLGDQLITHLVEVMDEATRAQVGPGRAPDSSPAFLGHLGDDRLMLITDSGIAHKVARPAIELFEQRVIASGISPQVALAEIGDAPAISGVSLRFLIVPEIRTSFRTPQEVLRTEPVLRAMANEQAAVDPTRAGYIVEAESRTESRILRVAA